MKNLKKAISAIGIMILFLGLMPSAVKAQGRAVSMQTFYDDLSYYGDWVNNPDYGYVWRPNVGSDFRPYYTNGHWLMTEYGNTWVSDYEWGWAPFHYGRWFYDNYDGWIWVPDTEWGPAWVDWRSGGGYYGWAPLGPRISININVGRRYYPDNYWVFIPQRCIYYPNYSRYWAPSRNVVIIRNTTIINNVYVDRNNRNVRYNSGPGVNEVRRPTRQDVKVYKVAETSRPSASRVDRGTVNVYRPQVERESNNTPRTVVSNNSARPSRSTAENDRSERSVGNTNSGNERPVRSTDVGRQSNVPDRGSVIDRGGNTSDSNGRPTRTSSTPQERQPVATERNSAPAPRQSTERPAPSSTRSSSAPQRTERSSAPSSSPSRVERSAPSSSSRAERSSGSSGRSSSGNESSRSSRPSR